MDYDYLGALRAGASPEDLARYLSKERGYDLDGALKAGAPVMGLIEYLSKDRPLSERLWQAGKEGVRNTVTAGELAATYDPEKTAEIVSEAVKHQTPLNRVQRQMEEEVKPLQEEYEKSSGFGAVMPFAKLAGTRIAQFAQNPEELAVSTVQNLPQSVPGIVGGLSGAGAGGAMGSVVPGVGTAAGAITGGILGGTAGAYPIEQGSAMQDLILQEARKQGIDPTDVEKLKPLVKEHYDEWLKQSRIKGIGTAGTDAAINVATLGVAGAGERTLLKEIDALTAAKQAGSISTKDFASELGKIQAKQEARNTLAAKALRGTGVTLAEMGGESASEAIGQELAYGKVDPLSVIDEAILGLGQGTGMSASRNILNKAAGQATNDAVDSALFKASQLIPEEEKDTGVVEDIQDLELEDRLRKVEKAQKAAEEPVGFNNLTDEEKNAFMSNLHEDTYGTGYEEQAAPIAPSGGVSFTTAKGSTYDVNADGTTTRNKAFRPEHGVEEQGIQPASHQTFYVDKKGLNALGGHFQSTPPSDNLAHQLVVDNGRAAVRRVDMGTGQASDHYAASLTPIHTEPAVGLYPVELWNNGAVAHFGNKITNVTTPSQETGTNETKAATEVVSPDTSGNIPPAATNVGSSQAPTGVPSQASDLLKTLGIGPTAKIYKAVGEHDLNTFEGKTAVLDALGNYAKTYPNAKATTKINEYLSSQQGATNDVTNTEPTGLTGSDATAMGSRGERATGDTGTSTVADGSTMEPSGTTTSASNVGKGTGEPALGLKTKKETADYNRLAEDRYNDIQNEYTGTYNAYADDLVTSHGGSRESFDKTPALHHRMVSKVLDDFRNAIQEYKDTALALQNKKLTKDDKAALRASQINVEGIKKYLGALGVNQEFIDNAEANPKVLKEAIPAFTESSREDEKRIAAQKNERAPRNEFLDMLTAFTPGKNYYGTGEEKALYEQAKQDAKNKGVERTDEKSLSKYSDEDLKQLRGLAKFKYMTLPDSAPETYADSVANSLRRIERELAKRAGTLDESTSYELPAGKARGTPLSAKVSAMLRGGNLNQALEAIANSHPNPDVKHLLSKLRKLNMKTKVRIGNTSDTEAGRYDADSDTIFLHPKYGSKEHVVIHEAVHAALSNVLKNPNHNVTKQFQEFFDAIKNQLGQEYGGTNLQEFAAEFLSNPDFQAKLKLMKAPKGPTMLSRIIEAIANLFGYNKGQTGYDKAYKLFDDTLNMADLGNVSTADMMYFGMGRSVSDSFHDLGDSLRHAHKVPRGVREKARNTISNIADSKLRKLLVDALALNNVAHLLTNRFNVDAKTDEASNRVADAIKNLDNVLNRRDSERHLRNAASGNLYDKLRRAERHNPKAFEALGRIAVEGSMERVDVLKDAAFEANAKNPKAYLRLKKEFDALPVETREAFKSLREKYDADIQEHIDVVTANTNQSIGNALKTMFTTSRLAGYVPLNRFGDYVVQFADPDNGEVNVMQFESAAERDDFIKQLKALKVEDRDIISHKRIEDMRYNPRAVAPDKLLGKVMDAMRSSGASQEQLDAIYQMHLSLFPTSSMAKRFMHRKGVKGASEDIIRSFANTQQQWDNRLVQAHHGKDLDDAIDTVKAAGYHSDDPLVQNAVQSVVDRSDYMRNPHHKAITNFATAASYQLYILGNISSAFVNLSALPMMVWPKLGSIYGFDKAQSAMSAVKGKALGNWGADPRYASLYKGLVDRNQLTNNIDREFLAARTVASKDHTGILGNVTHILSLPYLRSEEYNRAVTAMAAYDLAKSKNMSDAQAVEHAVRMVEDLHTSGSAASGARLMQSDLGRVFLTFKSFAWNSAFVAGKAFAEATRNVNNMQPRDGESQADFAQRQAAAKIAVTQARRHLLGMYGMAGAFGGIRGLPFYGMASVLANVLHALGGDDEEPWDLEHELEAFFGDAATNGFVNQLTDLQIGQRTAIVNDLLYRDNPRAVAEMGPVGATAVSMFGPLGGYATSVANSYDMFQQGHVERAVEGVMPSSVRNIMKGMRYASEGARTLKGDLVDQDIGAYSALMQVAGFAPAHLSSIQEHKAQAKAYEKGVSDRRTKVLNKMLIARDADDEELRQEALEDADKFSAEHPNNPITMETFRRSYTQHMTNQRRMIHGMVFNKKLTPEIQAKFFSDEDEEED